MTKIGILTFHYSNNYGGVLQALSLQKAIAALGYNAEVINFVPKSYQSPDLMSNLGLRRNLIKNKIKDMNLITIAKKIAIIKKFSPRITDKFNSYRNREMKLSKQVDEESLTKILNDYSMIIVGSDQIWNPSQRTKPQYFLDYAQFKGLKVSYAADSTVKEVFGEDVVKIGNALSGFAFISVRNKHSLDFVKSVVDKEVSIVADPTLIYDLDFPDEKEVETDYILTYILGKEINGKHSKILEQIKRFQGEMPVYAIKIPTVNFELPYFADKVFYDLSPSQWLNMFKKAKFIYTDSYHGLIFALKFHIPFLSYYTEELRATRLVDLGKRYGIERYVIQNADEALAKKSLEIQPDFKYIDSLIREDKCYSLQFLRTALQHSLRVKLAKG